MTTQSISIDPATYPTLEAAAKAFEQIRVAHVEGRPISVAGHHMRVVSFEITPAGFVTATVEPHREDKYDHEGKAP